MRFYKKKICFKIVICFVLQGPTAAVTVVNLFKHAELVSRHRQRNTRVCELSVTRSGGGVET